MTYAQHASAITAALDALAPNPTAEQVADAVRLTMPHAMVFGTDVETDNYRLWSDARDDLLPQRFPALFKPKTLKLF